jgi:hypothetical protein
LIDDSSRKSMKKIFLFCRIMSLSARAVRR